MSQVAGSLRHSCRWRTPASVMKLVRDAKKKTLSQAVTEIIFTFTCAAALDARGHHPAPRVRSDRHQFGHIVISGRFGDHRAVIIGHQEQGEC